MHTAPLSSPTKLRPFARADDDVTQRMAFARFRA
jgi:hypothetical protein